MKNGSYFQLYFPIHFIHSFFRGSSLNSLYISWFFHFFQILIKYFFLRFIFEILYRRSTIVPVPCSQWMIIYGTHRTLVDRPCKPMNWGENKALLSSRSNRFVNGCTKTLKVEDTIVVDIKTIIVNVNQTFVMSNEVLYVGPHLLTSSPDSG